MTVLDLAAWSMKTRRRREIKIEAAPTPQLLVRLLQLEVVRGCLCNAAAATAAAAAASVVFALFSMRLPLS